ncbi:MAG: DNA polymerase III subunit gamma/tau [Planctomycetota bacterium]
MPYTVLARRYRSSTFDEVVGQEAVARTLAAAIGQGRVAHAYLFCGTRGVGKTSMARIFAKALNNPDRDAEIDKAIMTGQDVDVVEIDGASNRGVEQAREVIANASYRPMRGRFKIYIIDEVHMLTKEAFNALLKTMEEPPEHVKFILATTEPEKVPATIQSRCQRFDFRNIPASRIAEHLRDVLEKEGLEAEPELVWQVARAGNGSMRDALSLLDRIAASGEKALTVKLLEELLGLPPREVLGELIAACTEGDPKTVLTRASMLLSQGVSAETVIESLLDRLRDLMIIAACGAETDLVELSDEARKADAALASRFDAAGLVHMIALCESVQRAMKTSSVPRALFDALMVRLAMTEHLADVAGLVLSGGGGSVPAGKG